MTEDQIKHMVDRFLGWKLPASFNPDNGVSFNPIAGENGPYPFKREPSGTNLFDAMQATEMVRYMISGMSARPDTAEARKGIVPLADHAAIGMMLVEKVPHPVYAAIVTITAHCAALQLDPSPDRVFDIGGCISQECMTLARAICPSKELEDAGKAVRDIRNELDRTRAECASWKEQFESASAAAAEYSEFWEKHSSDFDQFDNYVPHSQIDGDLRAAKAEIERLKAVSSPPAEARLREALDVAHGKFCKIAGTEVWTDGCLDGWRRSPGALREYAERAASEIDNALSPPSGGDVAKESEGGKRRFIDDHHETAEWLRQQIKPSPPADRREIDSDVNAFIRVARGEIVKSSCGSSVVERWDNNRIMLTQATANAILAALDGGR